MCEKQVPIFKEKASLFHSGTRYLQWQKQKGWKKISTQCKDYYGLKLFFRTSIWGHLAHEGSCIPVHFVLVQAIMCCSFSVIQGAHVEIYMEVSNFTPPPFFQNTVLCILYIHMLVTSHVVIWNLLPYLLECNVHLFWPNYVAKIRVRIRFDCKLEKHRWSRCSVSSRVFVIFFSLVYKN
jgi:hypothetical protein